MTGGRVAVIGDLAGHLEELTAELTRLGVGTDGRLPDDLTVIQVGDLIHRGPDSPGVVALVDHYLREQPSQWVQLAGNHEAQYLREPAFDWPERLAEEAQDTLRRWWNEGSMLAAAAVRSGGEQFLVTHAGVTREYWRQALAAPPRAADAARAVNSFIGRHDDVLFAAGQMLGGGDPQPLAGPVWAAAGPELAAGWVGVPMPFSQVHGHSRVSGRRGALADGLVGRLTVDRETAIETVALDGGRIIGVDPGHGRRARHPWRALVLPDAAVSVPA